MQEFVLAKDVLIICGKAQLSWKSFTSGHEKKVQHSFLEWGLYSVGGIQEEKDQAISGSFSWRYMILLKHSTTRGSMFANMLRSFSERDATGLDELNIGAWGQIPLFKESVMTLRKVPEAIEPFSQMIGHLMDTQAPEVATDHRPSLYDLLLLFIKSEVTNPRDRLFAFLGLALDGDAFSLRPSYDESIESVFLRYARYFIETGDGFRLLSHSSGILNKELSIPSWAPDCECRMRNFLTFSDSFMVLSRYTAPKLPQQSQSSHC